MVEGQVLGAAVSGQNLQTDLISPCYSLATPFLLPSYAIPYLSNTPYNSCKNLEGKGEMRIFATQNHSIAYEKTADFAIRLTPDGWTGAGTGIVWPRRENQ